MPTVNLSPIFNGTQVFGVDGLPLSAGLLWTYQAGTSTTEATYTTNAGSVANTNPIVLGPDGRPPQEIWLIQGQAYKFVLMTALSVLIESYDNISGVNDDTSLLAFEASLASSSGSSLVGFIQAGTGSVPRTAQDKMRDAVDVKDKGGVLDDSSSPTRTANSAALLAAVTTGKRVEIGAGTLWIDPNTALPVNAQIVGKGKNSTFIKGDGDLLVLNSTTFGANSEPYLADFTIANDATRGKLISVSGVSADYGRVQFDRIQFGKSTHHVQGSSSFATVDWYFNGCRFSDASVRSRDIPSCWAYKEVACYTWNGVQGLVVNTGASITCVGSVFELMSGEPFYALANVVAGIDTISFIGCHFEQNGSSGASDIKLETTVAARIRSISLIGTTLYTPNASMTKRITITEGGSGTIDKVTIGEGCSVEGSVSLCDDVTRVFIDPSAYFNAITPRDTNQIPPVVNYAARNVLSSSGQFQPQSTPSSAWDYDSTNRSAISIANNGTYDLATGSGLVVVGEAAGQFGPGLLLLGAGTVTIVSQVGTNITTTSGTGSKVNIFYTGSAYRIENKLGATINVFLDMQRVRASN